MKIYEMKLGTTKEDLIEKQRRVLELINDKKKSEEDCFFTLSNSSVPLTSGELSFVKEGTFHVDFF